MKQILSIALIISILFPINPMYSQQTVSMGPGYIYDVFYSLEDGVIDFVERDDWDLAFFTDPMSGGIITNCGTSLENHVRLWAYPNGDSTAWMNIDTNGLAGWPLLYNGEDSWENGAFNRNALGSPDYGWGVKDAATGNINGDSIFIIQLADGTYKQLWIQKKITAENKYKIRWADIDNTSEDHETLNIDNYLGMNFAYFDFESGSLFDREPETDEWDLLFTRYHALQEVGVHYLVAGVLSNVNTPGNRFYPVSIDFNDWFLQPLEPTKATIGWDWKWFSFATGWNIEDSMLYFIQSPNGNVYKLYFTDFAGTSSGDITFEQKMVSMVGIDHTEGNDVEMQLLPNPASNTLTVIWDHKLFEEASLSICDITGKEVMSRNLTLHDNDSGGVLLDISILNEGMYVVSIVSGNTMISKKLMVR
jgi:hypothetical protein